MSLNIPENTSKNTHNIVAELLLEEKKVDAVLDIPSGAGAFTQRLLNKGINVYSGDIENILMVENENFAVTDMNKRLPYEDGKFDSIICIDGIEHIERPFDFVRECHRTLAKDGTVIFSTPNINSIRSRWRWFWTGHHNKQKSPLNENHPTPLHHINMLSYQKLRYILHTNGFRIEKVRANRYKFVSWLYIIFAPLSYLFTSLVYLKEEKDKQQRKINKEIQKETFKLPLLLGETMIVKARKF